MAGTLKVGGVTLATHSDLTPSQAWIDYCQALRDLPANSEPQLNENRELTNVTWPEKPE